MNTTTRESAFGRPRRADEAVEAVKVDDPVRVDVRRREQEAGGPAFERLRAAVGDALDSDLATDLDRVRKLARLMDARFSVAGVRFGLDGLIGLIPGVGDTVSALVSLYPLAIARRHRLGKWVQAKMLGNIAVDWVVGLVPLVGDLFDVGYKANLRNLAVIERAAAKRGVVPAFDADAGPAAAAAGRE